MVETRCDICHKLLAATDNGIPSLKTMLESVRMTLLCDGEGINFHLCPRCLRRMKRYLKKHGDELDKEDAE